MTRIPVEFRHSAQSLSPVAALGPGPVARVLAERLLRSSDEELRSLRGIAGRDGMLVIGDESHLPWVDGIIYLGRHPVGPSLLIPTHLELSVGGDLLERALKRASTAHPEAYVVLPDPPRVITVGVSSQLCRARVVQWLEGTQ